MVVDPRSPVTDPRDTEVGLDFAREWIEFVDPDDEQHIVRADLTWLNSSWTCIWGSGCHGIIKDRPQQGCCSHGAFFTDKDDEKRVKKFVKQLDPQHWQYYPKGQKAWTERDSIGDEENRLRTRTVDGACIFHNRAGFEGGEGCALHSLALRTGKHPLETKPDVCWQLPIRREQEWVDRPDDTRVLVSTITEFGRRHWGTGGHDLHWWCTSSTEAHVERTPLYERYGPELTELLGPGAYAELVRLAAARLAAGMIAAHPASPPQR